MAKQKAVTRIWFALSGLLLLSCAAEAAGKEILVIESYNQNYSWDKDYCDALREKLGETSTLQFFALNTKELPAVEHEGMADKAWKKYDETKPDLVVLGDDAAFKLLAPRLAATVTPVVYLGINNNPRNYFEDKSVPRMFTGVLERPVYKRMVLIASEIVPGAKNCLLLFDTNITSQIIRDETFRGKNREEIGGIAVDLQLLETFEEWKTAVTEARGKYDFIITGLYQAVKDAEGKPVPANDVVTWVSVNTPVPVFGFWDFSVGKDKTLGGLVLDGREMGLKASDLIAQILAGKPVTEILPVTENSGKYLFSTTQLEKWKITLPKDIKDLTTFIE